MNKQLKDRIFKLPENVLIFLSQQRAPDGTTRNNTLLTAKEVTYGQLKRILHDMKYMDKNVDRLKYDSYGGFPLEQWGTKILNDERKLIDSRKSTRKASNEIGSLNGLRGNAYLSTHTKNNDSLPPTNLMKSNSEKTSVSGLSEQIIRIKKLMK